jgi:division protein CdvB (Snf7/Vps24/ESCRT-III family)
MTTFANNWQKPQTPSFSEKFNDVIKPKGALKPRLENGIKRLQTQVSKLDGMITKLKQRDEKLFKRIVVATQNHDISTSQVLSKELSEVRKVTKLLGNARIALEQIELRLSTFHDLGDTVVTIMPTIGLMKNLRSSLIRFMPEADRELAGMTEMLGGLMTDTFHNGDFGVDSGSTSEESEKILQEASAVAEAAINDKLPSMPVGQSSSPSRYI